MKVLQLTALDGSKWNIPATVIADSFKAHYGAGEEPDDGDLIEWAGNDMNWSDVREHAVQVKGADALDMEDSWNEGDFEIADDMAARVAEVVKVSTQAELVGGIVLTQEQVDVLALSVKVGEAMTSKDYLDLFYAMRDEAPTILAGVQPGDHGDAIIAAFGERAARVALLKAAGL